VVSTAALRLMENTIPILGGAWNMRDHKIGMHHRDDLVYIIGEGVRDVQRNIISRAIQKGEAKE